MQDLQDLDVLPKVEEDTNGAVGGVRRSEALVAQWAAIARNTRAFLPLPWITVIAATWATTAMVAVGREGQGFPRLTPSSIPSRCLLPAPMRLHVSSLLSKTSSS